MAISQADLAAAQALLEADAVNLDEVVPEPVRVTVREYQDVPAEEGQPARRKLVTRTALIETYVPLDLYDGMLAARARIQGLVNSATAAMERATTALKFAEGFHGPTQAEDITAAKEQVAQAEIARDEATRQTLTMMTEMVWKVWRLTEPGMTLEALRSGISLVQVRGLFQAFFASASLPPSSSQETAAPGTSDNGSSMTNPATLTQLP